MLRGHKRHRAETYQSAFPAFLVATTSTDPDQHDGEKDSKGPADFSGNVNPKVDDIGDENDDDGDDDEDVPSRNKRGRDGKLKPPSDMHVGGV